MGAAATKQARQVCTHFSTISCGRRLSNSRTSGGGALHVVQADVFSWFEFCRLL